MSASSHPDELSSHLPGLRLDAETRHVMLAELDQDLAERRLFLSRDLSERGRADFEHLLRAAIEAGTAASFAEDLAACERVVSSLHWRRSLPEQPGAAAGALAQDELHRFYARAMCRQALARGIHTLVIYRAKPAAGGRAPSDALVGVRIDARSLLEDLRASPDLRLPSGLPPYRDSGLSVRLP